MILRNEELALARAYVQSLQMEYLTREQMKSIMDRGRALHRWFREHHRTHVAINAAVLGSILIADFLILIRLPRLLVGAGGAEPTGSVLAAALLCGSLHSAILYSLSVFSAHEGAAHQIIFPPRGPVTRVLNAVANNLCRLAGAEPRYYSGHHMSHHARFGTEHDGEFLNFVLPRRFWLTLLPLAAIINYTDFISHRPMGYTRSRLLSAAASLAYHLIYGWFTARQFGALFTVLTFLLFFPHVGFFLDRVRQFTEHNLMPLENKDGARSFGLGFWGMLIGGGPWGSPCHWEHHLVPSLPWYQQLTLHRHVVRVLTPAQRKQFLIHPVTGFPRLLFRLLSEPGRFARQVGRLEPHGLEGKAGPG